MYLATAIAQCHFVIASNADVIITGDQDLLTLVTYQEISIMTPKSFLNQFH
ncbi:hypothetical protein WEU38_16780 [Cyanobacterium aponinum AL20118]|uniref:Toxin-antitoxin system toxin component, PIN family n=1 Tax=Cyanobacterium aponinum AL20115 TaxID=3090662 RepID=A0AAF0ZI29_9CHRO|nr:hypothetical protein [Cyanobacterium aponinum]WPF88442.1 hypothetical protein SAY89_16860 [Cyanobacterium aponinum AL20115]